MCEILNKFLNSLERPKERLWLCEIRTKKSGLREGIMKHSKLISKLEPKHCVLNSVFFFNLYILRGFKKLVITFFDLQKYP